MYISKLCKCTKSRITQTQISCMYEFKYLSFCKRWNVWNDQVFHRVDQRVPWTRQKLWHSTHQSFFDADVRTLLVIILPNSKFTGYIDKCVNQEGQSFRCWSREIRTTRFWKPRFFKGGKFFTAFSLLLYEGCPISGKRWFMIDTSFTTFHLKEVQMLVHFVDLIVRHV